MPTEFNNDGSPPPPRPHQQPPADNVIKDNNSNVATETQAYLEEIQRLKLFLVELDNEINEESKKSRHELEELKNSLREKELQIQELVNNGNSVEEQDDNYVYDLEEENKRLSEVIATQNTAIQEANQINSNLQSALTMLQANVQSEINSGLAEERLRSKQLELKLSELNENRPNPNKECVINKLAQDLDNRNFLIDQLNEEVNYLKGQISNLLKGDSSIGRDGVIDKGYVRSLLISLFQPPNQVSQSEILGILVKVLGMNEEEMRVVGIKDPLFGLDGSSDAKGQLNHGLSDIWVSFLLRETQDGPRKL